MEFEYNLKLSKSGFLHIEIKPNGNMTGYIPNISGWLSSDVQNMGKTYFLPIFEKVIGGVSEEEVIAGNAYEAVIRKDYTTISYNFEYCNSKMVPCTLPTQMLYEILEIWIKAYDDSHTGEFK